MSTKRDTIEAILTLNPTASRAFLADFPRDELNKYLTRLCSHCKRRLPSTISGLADLSGGTLAAPDGGSCN